MSEETANFWDIKEEIRVLGIDDGPFEFGEGNQALLVGTVFRGGSWLDGVLTTKIAVDGDDASGEIIGMILRSRHRGQVRVVMTDGLTVGGFNVIDAREIFESTGLPVISVTRTEPDLESIRTALQKFPDAKQRWERIHRAGPPIRHFSGKPKGRGSIFFQGFGIKESDARSIIEITSTRSLLPEPIRVAHIIASGVIRGESYGRV
ncbi:MAG: DUF99 family protein [Theionarchaea archaeon]|nr:DUF99 family protein [Theionarchaea archaeon]